MATKNEYRSEWLRRRTENGLCQLCGNKLDRQGIYCKECAEKTNKSLTETRHWYKENGICPRCRKEKIYGDEGMCPECRAKGYIDAMRIRDKEHYNEIHREWEKKTHQKMIERGICTRCRKRKADNGYKTCGICRNKIRLARQKSDGYRVPRAERYKLGICAFCDSPLKDGYKVCEKHYQMNVEKLKHKNVLAERERRKNMDHNRYERTRKKAE